MRLLKYPIMFIVGVAPIAALACLVGTFFHLGGWGWLLFLWFGFTGMFSLGVLKLHEEENPNAVVILGLSTILILAFVGGALFAVSDLPERVSVFYALLAPLFIIPFLAMRARSNKQVSPKHSKDLENFSKEIESWPEDQARTALLLVKATVSGDKHQIDRLYPELTVGQLKAVEQVLRKMEKGEA